MVRIGMLWLLGLSFAAGAAQARPGDTWSAATTQVSPNPPTPAGDVGVTLPSQSVAADCYRGTNAGAEAYPLTRLIDMALCLNPETRAAREQLIQAQSSVGLIKATYMPQVSLQAIGGFQRTPLPIPTNLISAGYFTSDTREFIPALSAKWIVFDFGRRSGKKAAAEANTNVASAGLSGVEQKVVFGVIKAYYQLAAARGKRHSSEESLKAAQVEQNAALAERQHGRATVVVVAQANRAVAQAELYVVKSDGDVESAYAGLLAAVGLNPTERIEVADLPEAPSLMLPDKPVTSYIDAALAGRPDVLAATAEVQAAEREEDATRAEYRPTISMSAQYFQNIGSLSSDGSPYVSVDKPGGAIFVNFEWPLFDGGLRRNQVHIASSKVAEAQDKLDGVKHEAENDVVDAYNAVKTAAAEYNGATALRDASKVAYSAAFDAYKNGVGTYTDLESSRASLAQAQAAVEDATADFETARASLALATGLEVSYQP